jgi:integrase/recombinase XerD
VARNFSAIRSFHRFLVSEDLVQKDATEHLRAPRLWKRLPSVLHQSEVERLLQQPDLSKPAGIRDRAMLELMYAAPPTCCWMSNLFEFWARGYGNGWFPWVERL